MGSTTTYKRRKQCSFCLNSLERSQISAQKNPCDCQAEDLKCAYGFYRADNINNPNSACSEDKDVFSELCEQGDTTPAMAFYERIPDNLCKPDDLSDAFLSARATYCNGSPGSTQVPTDFSYRGCYYNGGVDRVSGHTRGISFEECRKLANVQGKPYFGTEWPQGFDEEGLTACLPLDGLPQLHPRPDEECAQEVDSAGHLLGSANRIAV